MIEECEPDRPEEIDEIPETIDSVDSEEDSVDDHQHDSEGPGGNGLEENEHAEVPTGDGNPESDVVPIGLGSTVGDRYSIQEAVAVLEDSVVYKGAEDGYLRWCSVCSELYILEEDDEFCDECGAELIPGWYRITKYPDEEGPAGVDSFVQARLAHDSWLVPTDWFVWYGQRYMVQEWFEGDPPKDACGRFGREDVLAWGASVAEGLQLLHENGFAGLPLMPDDMLVSADSQVKLVNWGPFELFPLLDEDSKNEMEEVRQQDLQNLASLLTVLFAGGGEGENGNSQPIDPVLREILSDMAAGEYDDAMSVAADLSERLHGEEPVQVSELESAQKTALHIRGAGRSHVGRVRPLNEDSISTMDFSVVRDSLRENAGLYVVADGVGGHDSGEIASRIAVGTIARYVTERLLIPDLDTLGGNPDEPAYGAMIGDAVRAANEAVVAAGPEHNSTNMGTTVTAALVVGSFAYIANVGDSRTYLYREGRLTAVTTDHSVVARLVAIGMIQPEEVYTHPQRNYVYRALGNLEDFLVDTFFQPLLPGDRLVLCSDGLWEMVHDPELQYILGQASSSQEACDRLVEQANANGGEDNISVVIVDGAVYEDAG